MSLPVRTLLVVAGLCVCLLAVFTVRSGRQADGTEADKPLQVTEVAEEESGGDGRGPNRVGNHFPETAYEYARMVEPELGVPPRVNLDTSVEIPLYVNGVQTYGNLGRSCDNPTFLGKDAVSGSTLQRYEGRTADGELLPEVVWVSFGRNSSSSHEHVVGSVQMIGLQPEDRCNSFL